MTYCVGMALESGIIFASDSRTNAGVDHISTFRKMFMFEKPKERVFVLLTAGNLAMTQAILHHLRYQINQTDNPQAPSGESLFTASTMFEAASLVGKTVRHVHNLEADALRKHGIESHMSLLFGGQIKGEQPRLYHIYNAGNFIEATPETPYFQIGESKYGKPILDRVVNYKTTMEDATKCALISFDSTIKSNISVSMPIDLLCYEKDSLSIAKYRRIVATDPYFSTLRQGWSDGLREVFAHMPNLDWS